jgi:hypothetical protein
VNTSLQALGIEGLPFVVEVGAGLRDPQVYPAVSRRQGLLRESDNAALTVGCSPMRLDLKSLLTLDLPGRVHVGGIRVGLSRQAVLDQVHRDGPRTARASWWATAGSFWGE